MTATALRVLPMVGKGPEQNIKDVMFLRGVDMGITQANILKHMPRPASSAPISSARSPISPSCSTRKCTSWCVPT